MMIITLSIYFPGVGDSIKTRYEPVRVEMYAEAIVPLYSDIGFKSHFRMKRSTFEVTEYCCTFNFVILYPSGILMSIWYT